MESQRWKEYNGDNHRFLSEYDDLVLDRCVSNRKHSPPLPPSAFPSSLGYIRHPVSKMDTLAGIAIKYGVEVSDIKKMNGLVTDLQMFALKTLHIPLRGRHPPSDDSTTTGHRTPDELFDLQHSLTTDSPLRKSSPGGNSLQGFYRIKPMDKKTISDDFQMAVNGKGASNFSEDVSSSQNLASTHQPLSRHRKSKSLVDIILSEIEEQPDILPATEETLLREDNSGACGFPSRTGKGLALRQKSASRASLTTDSEASASNSGPLALEDICRTDSPSGVKKSSSTSCLYDEARSPSIWPTSKWSLRPDFQAKPKFDGLPKPTIGRRNKAAIDKHI
ncbi:uncharacterized protein LOC129311168 [Prosopis cineraria]|uniref:uncharacterized protein LOC129311168 n=1 Tax=Prosopis cineraria TaxID=364024 RepID=UPI00240F978C|nr:uncharacterized protein LOC129311168 [Prosopis cineraria]